MFEDTGLVTCPCCGCLIEVHRNGSLGWSAYLPHFNCNNAATQTNIIQDYMVNPVISQRDQWKQINNNRSNMNACQKY